jgi:hypothetical protein
MVSGGDGVAGIGGAEPLRALTDYRMIGPEPITPRPKLLPAATDTHLERFHRGHPPPARDDRVPVASDGGRPRLALPACA